MKLLLATDGSFHGVEAARFLTGLIPGESLEVTLLSISYEPEGFANASSQSWLPEFRQRETEQVGKHHAELEEILTACGASVSSVRAIGNPRVDIVREAKSLGSDLIVMGARGHSAIGRILLGSTSDYVATNAECSVLVVRSKSPGEEVQPAKKVTIAYDGSAGSREAIEELMEFKLAQNTVANVISVVPTLDFYNVPHSVRTEEREAEEMEEKRLSGKRIASRLSRDVTRTDAQVVKGKHTGESIVLAAEQNDADLVVVGETGHRLLSKWILGSTSEYVLRHAPCSVWVSRHHRRADTFETSEREDVREEHDFGSLTSDVSDRDSDRLSS